MAVPRGNNKSVCSRRLIARLSQHLNSNDPAAAKGDRFRWVSDPGRNVRVIKRIVKGTADSRVVVTVVTIKFSPAAIITAVPERTVRIWIRRVRVIVLVINPRLDGVPARHARSLLIRRAPSQI